MNYYYLDESKTPHGPISSKKIIDLVAQGILELDTYIALEGEDTWKLLRDVLPTLNIPVPVDFDNRNIKYTNERVTQ